MTALMSKVKEIRWMTKRTNERMNEWTRRYAQTDFQALSQYLRQCFYSLVLAVYFPSTPHITKRLEDKSSWTSLAEITDGFFFQQMAFHSRVLSMKRNTKVRCAILGLHTLNSTRQYKDVVQTTLGTNSYARQQDSVAAAFPKGVGHEISIHWKKSWL